MQLQAYKRLLAERCCTARDVAIITPYKAQQQYIERKLAVISFLYSIFGPHQDLGKESQLHIYKLIDILLFGPRFHGLCFTLWAREAFQNVLLRKLNNLPGALGKNASETAVGTVFSMQLDMDGGLLMVTDHH